MAKPSENIIAAIMMLLALLIPASGCTHNDGDIGSLFGLWKLSSVRYNVCDGPDPSDHLFWAFESSTLRMTVVGDRHTVSDTYANWRMADNTLFIDFPDDNLPPPAEMPLPRQSAMQIIEHTSRRLIVEYNPPETSHDTSGMASVIYTFTKW